MQRQRGVLTLPARRNEGRHYSMAPRNLSVEGAGVLIGMYIPVGTRCFLTLRSSDGGAKRLTGVVARCRLAQGHLHDVGIRLDSKINPEEFLITIGSDLRFKAERADATTLAGLIVHADTDPTRGRLLHSYFNGSAISVLTCPDAASALEALTRDPILALVHDPFGSSGAAEFIAQARSAGVTCPVVALVAREHPALRRRLIEAGAHEVLRDSAEAKLFHLAAAEFSPVRLDRTDDELPPSSAEHLTLEARGTASEVRDAA